MLYLLAVNLTALLLMKILRVAQADKTKMTEMWSQQGEKVPFEKPVEAKGAAPCIPVPALKQLSNERYTHIHIFTIILSLIYDNIMICYPPACCSQLYHSFQ